MHALLTPNSLLAYLRANSCSNSRYWANIALLLLLLAIVPPAVAQTVATVGNGGQFGAFDLSTRQYSQVAGSISGGGVQQVTNLAYDGTSLYILDRGGSTRLRTLSFSGVASASLGTVLANGSSDEFIGMSFGNGTLYTTARGNERLTTISRINAATTQPGVLNYPTGNVLSGKLAFVGSILYGTLDTDGNVANGLYSYNLATGAGTLLGNGGAASTYTDMIAFSNGSTLYGINGITLYQINTANGNLTNLGAITGANVPSSFVGAVVAPVPPSVSIAVAPSSVTEDGASNLVFTVTRSLNLASPTVVNIGTSGSATSGTDYTGGVVTVTIPAGATTGTITINPSADSTIEPDETVILSVTSGSGYTVGAPSSATGTILNDDSPNLTINDVSLNEGNAGTTSFTFTVSLSTPAGPGGVSFDIATANGTATAGSDYTAKSLTGQTIPAGSSTYSFTVLVNGDTLTELNETFFVNVTGVINAILVDAQGQGTIINDDVPSASITVAPANVLEDGATNLIYTVTLNQAALSATTVNLSTSGTASSVTDYTGALASVVIGTGNTIGTITINPTADTTVEPDETVIISVTSGSGYTVGTPASATGTILNDDNAPPTISNVANQTINEDGNTGAVAITVGDAETPVASLTMSGSSSNTTLVPNANVVFGGGGANRTVTVTPAANLSGTSTITVTVNDGTANTSDTFLLTVNAVNDLPSFVKGANQTHPSGTNTAQTVVSWATAINDGDPDFTQTLTFNVSNNNNGLFTTQPTVAANGTLNYTPNGTSGSATVTLSLTDDATAGGAALTSAPQTFTITVSANTPPTITDITNQSTNEDTATSAIAFTIGDAETAVTSLTVSGSSSNPFLVPNANIVIGGSGANRTVTVTPVANISGSSTLTIAVTDGNSVTTSDTFVLIVKAVNDLPSFIAGGNQAHPSGTNTAQTVASWATAIDSGDPDFIQALSFNVTNNNNGLFTTQPSVATDGTLSYTPNGTSGSATVSVSLTDDATAGGAALTSAIQTLTISVQACTTFSFPYTLVGADNTARVANLRDAIVCANTNGASADTIDLGGQTVALADVYGSYNGPTGLPQIRTAVTLRNGTISRSGANIFRLISVGPTGNLALNNISAINGFSGYYGGGGGGGEVGSGGAVYNEGIFSATLCHFLLNTSTFKGGAIYNYAGTVSISQSTISGNVTSAGNGGSGGGLLNHDGTAALTNVLISGNYAPLGGGISNIGNGVVTLSNNTIAGNFCTFNGGGIRNQSTLAIVLNNTLIYGNESNDLPALGNVDGTITNNNSLVGINPAFVSPLPISSVPTTGGDYRLSDFSVAVDAGNNSLVPGGTTTDLAGQPRFYNDLTVVDTGVGSAPLVDIGAYERQANSNTPPTISDISNQSTNEDSATGAIALTVGDAQTAVAALTMSGTSSNTTLVPNANIVFSGSGANRTVTVTPAANLSGTSTITVTVNDGTANTSDTFLLTVNAVNDLPSFVKGANRSHPSGTNTAQSVAAWATAISDGDADFFQALIFNVSNNNNALFTTQPSVAANGTLSYTPNGTSGIATVSVSLTDDATAGGAALTSAIQTFTITISANTSPTISNVTNQTINEDAATSALAITIGDAETAVGALTMSGMSSNTTLVPNANIVFGGSGANRTVTVTPSANLSGTSTITVTVNDGTANTSDTFLLTVNAVNDLPSFVKGANQTRLSGTSTTQMVVGWATAINDGDADFTQALSFNVSNNNNGLFATQPTVAANGTLSYTPNGTSGSATVSVSLTDDATAGGAALTSAIQTFTITISANTSPTISNVTNQTINEDAATSALAITIGDAETAVGALTMSGMSSNTTLVPNANIVFGGSGANRTVTVTPAANLSGTSAITVTVSDGTANTSDTFVLTVNAVNDLPSFIAGGNQTRPSGTSTAQTVAAWATAINDGDPDFTQALTFNVSNNNNGLFTAQPTVAANGTLNYTPNGTSGSATVSVSLTDDATAGGAALTSAIQTFTITISANTPPTISNVTNQTINEDAATTALAITVGDAETAVGALTMSGTSSNTTLVPNANIIFGGSGANRTVTVTPAANLSGTSTITVTVTDGNAGSTSDTFLLTVNAVNDLPSFIAGGNQTRPSGTNTAQTVAAWATAINDGDPDFTQALTFNVSNNNNALFTTQPTVAANGTLQYTPTGTPGSATVSVNLTDDATAGGAALTSAIQTFTITVQAGATLIINDVSMTEGNAGSQNMTFTVTRSFNTGAFAVDVATGGGTATAGADYTAISTTLNFTSGGALTQTVTVPVLGDTDIELDETFIVTLANPTNGATLADATGTGTIINDDVPGLSVGSVTLAENAGPAVLRISVSSASLIGPITGSYSTTDGTAVTPGDYTAQTAVPFSIPANATFVDIAIPLTNDSVFEPTESFSVSAAGVSGATVSSDTGTVTITDDDQQPTTTTIGSDLPDPSVTGQSYAVNVSVVGSSASPLGTVNVSDGAATCTITLAAGTAPNSAGVCNLTSTTAGAKTLTATYVPASTAFGASTDTEAHQVNAASTSLSLTPPARIRINTLTAIPFSLSVNTPGAGTPSGTVTISAGGSPICSATLPATSCSATFSSLGARSLSASFAPSNADYLASSAAVSPNNVLVFALSDLSVSKSNGVSTYNPGDLLVYTIIVRNLGPDASPNVRVLDVVPLALQKVRWTCIAAGGAVCPEVGGVDNIDAQLQSLPSGGSVSYLLSGFVANPAPDSLSNTASLVLPIDTSIEDPDLGNQSETDSDLAETIFSNGFENAQ